MTGTAPTPETTAAIRRVDAAEEVARILAEFDHAFPRSISSRVTDLQTHARKLRDRGNVYAAEEGGRCLGFVAFYANDHATGAGFVSHIAVAAEARGCGVGQRLMATCVDDCRSAGMRSLRLEVDAVNTAAISFYESLGFRVEGEASAVSVYLARDL